MIAVYITAGVIIALILMVFFVALGASGAREDQARAAARLNHDRGDRTWDNAA